MKLNPILCLLVFCLFSCNYKTPTEAQATQPMPSVQPAADKDFQVIAFGSCNREDLPQPMWKVIAACKPDLWVWLGDNIYGDTRDMSVMKRKYDKQLSHPEYAAFVQNQPIIGIWDDHDFGTNDGGKEYTAKEASKQLMLDFLGVPESAPQRSRPGAYSAYDFGEGDRKIKIILLDVRWFRDPITKLDGVYQPNNEGTILGEEQWAWLEKELAETDATINIIGGGIQMLPEDHRFEKWANFPLERQRLIDLLLLHQPPGLVLLSGDRHIGEFSRVISEGQDFQLFEITSSGLTHSYEIVGNEPNRHRLGKLTGKKNFGLLFIDWDQSPPGLAVELRGEGNTLIARENITQR